MSLSNTAIPKYYQKFKEEVLSGRLPVCKEIEMQMNRIDAKIADPRYYYDDEAINGYVQFCENECTLTDGSNMHLLDSFKLWAEDLLSWFYFVDRSVYVPAKGDVPGHYVVKRIKKRLTTKQILVVGRGAAKSVYASTIQSYFLNIDPSSTDQVATAPTLRQADEVMSPIRIAITRAPGPYFKFMTLGSLQNTTGNRADRCKLASTKKGIQNFLNGSIIETRPMSIDKLQGLRVKVATVDEWLSGDIREDVIGALEQGASKLDDYVILAISSEGTVRNSSGDTIKMEILSILRNEFINDHVSIWYYKLDNIMEVGDPSMWVKANPNLGKTVTYDAYQQDVDRAEKAPATRNDILAKRFGIPMEGFTYFFTYEQTIKCDIVQNYWQMPCAMGADLSQGDDFCAFSFLFPLPRGCFGIKTRCYITELTLSKLPASLRQKYEEFIQEGSLIIMPGAVLDMMAVYDELDTYIINNAYDVRAFGYDPYNAAAFVQRWISENSGYSVEKVAQGSRTETVPLGDLRNLADQRMLIFDQEIMSYCMGNAITINDNNGNRKLSKERRANKIDSVAALIDAYVVYVNNRDNFDKI